MDPSNNRNMMEEKLNTVVDSVVDDNINDCVAEIIKMDLNTPDLMTLSKIIVLRALSDGSLAKVLSQFVGRLRDMDSFKHAFSDFCNNKFEAMMNDHHLKKTQLAENGAGEKALMDPTDIRPQFLNFSQFVAELFLLKVLSMKVVGRFIEVLLTVKDDLCLDCVCTLLSIGGEELDRQQSLKASNTIQNYFDDIASSMRGDATISEDVKYKLKRLSAERDSVWTKWPKQKGENYLAKCEQMRKDEKKRRRKERKKLRQQRVLEARLAVECKINVGEVDVEPSFQMCEFVEHTMKDLVDQKDFKGTHKIVEQRLVTYEQMKSFLKQTFLFCLKRDPIYRWVLSELIAELLRSGFYKKDHIVQRMIYVFLSYTKLLQEIPNLWLKLAEILNASLREEQITIIELRSALEKAYLKRSDASARFICSVLKVLKANNGEMWVQLVAWDNSKMTLGDFIQPTEIRHYISKFELDYLVKRPSLVVPETRAINVENVKQVLINYIKLNADLALTRIYKWCLTHVGDTVESEGFIITLTLAICEVSLGLDNSIDLKFMRKNSKILEFYLKRDNLYLHKASVRALKQFVNLKKITLTNEMKIVVSLYDKVVVKEAFLSEYTGEALQAILRIYEESGFSKSVDSSADESDSDDDEDESEEGDQLPGMVTHVAVNGNFNGPIAN